MHRYAADGTLLHSWGEVGHARDLRDTRESPMLARNRGRAFSRTYLRDALRGEPHVEGDRSVDNAVLRLRRKLGHMGEAIETVWGVGYRFSRAEP
ncbi:MAG: winged helix-turn-helix domain-containing protein [Chloroflexota bacterium]